MAAVPATGTTHEQVITTWMAGVNILRLAAGLPALTHVVGGPLRWQHDGLSDASGAAHIVWDDTNSGGEITGIDGLSENTNPISLGLDRCAYMVSCWADTQPNARELLWTLVRAMEIYVDERTAPRPWRYRARVGQGSTATGYCYDVAITIVLDIPAVALTVGDPVWVNTGTINNEAVPALSWTYPVPEGDEGD